MPQAQQEETIIKVTYQLAALKRVVLKNKNKNSWHFSFPQKPKEG